MKSRPLQISILFIGLLFSPTLFAWGFKGHVLVAQIAYNNLTPTAKNKVNHLSIIIFQRLSVRWQERLNRNYKGVSTFAKIAVLPDNWRNWKLGTIFQHFDAPVPNSLKDYMNKRTASWHFINQPFPNTTCHTIKPKNVVWALQNIIYTLSHEKNQNAQAVLLILLAHLVGDANQPLHTISKVDSQCRGDKGGNLYCLREGRGRKCRKNLHQLWDYAVGFLKSRKNFLNESIKLQERYPKSAFPEVAITSRPDEWVKQEYRYAPFIYSTPKFQKPSPAYYRKGQQIAQRQITLAGYRLAYLLDATFSYSKHSVVNAERLIWEAVENKYGR